MTAKLGSLIIDLQGVELSQEEKELLAHPLVGGVILFTRNYESREQLKNLCHHIRSARKSPCLIMVDQEGGRVQRFIPEFTRLPRMGIFGNLYNDDPVIANQMAKECGWLLAAELLSVGVDLSLTPVLDLNKGVSTVIGERAFHADPKAVIQLATALMQGMHEAGMASTGKHFPGHGSVSLDSHVAMPIDERPFDIIEKEDLIPFRGMIQAGISAMMAAHITFPKVDSLAVGFSKRWLRDILRTQLGFKGVIFSDDLTMEGANISTNYADRVHASREAGCDFALVCNNRKGVIQVLDNLPYAMHQVEKEKWGALQGNFSYSEEALNKQPRWQKINKFLLEHTNAST